MSADLVGLLYLAAGVLFILALRGLSSPETSRRGNLFGMVGMAIAIVTTLASHPPAGFGAGILVVLGLATGGGVGAVPSGLRTRRQPHRWTAMRWWNRHASRQLSRVVGPPSAFGIR